MNDNAHFRRDRIEKPGRFAITIACADDSSGSADGRRTPSPRNRRRSGSRRSGRRNCGRC